MNISEDGQKGEDPAVEIVQSVHFVCFEREYLVESEGKHGDNNAEEDQQLKNDRVSFDLEVVLPIPSSRPPKVHSLNFSLLFKSRRFVRSVAWLTVEDDGAIELLLSPPSDCQMTEEKRK